MPGKPPSGTTAKVRHLFYVKLHAIIPVSTLFYKPATPPGDPLQVEVKWRKSRKKQVPGPPGA
jgi:hypothetical protein